MAQTNHRPFLPALLLASLAALVALALGLGVAGEPTLPAPVDGEVRRPGLEVLAGSAGGMAAVDRDGSEVARGPWMAPVGSRFVHRLVDHCEFEIRSPEGGAQPGGVLHSECDVETVVLARRSGEVLVRQQITGLRFVGADGKDIANDPIQASFATAAQAPVFVRLGPAGQILGYGFAGALDGDQRNFLRGTLGLFAFEAPPVDAMRWTSQVEDTTGAFDARYEVVAKTDDAVTVRRERVRYTAIAGHDEVPKHELRGASEGRFHLSLGWLESARIDEGMTLSLSILDLQATTARRAELALTANDTTTVASDEVDWARADAPASGRLETIGGYAAGNERRRWAQRLEGVSLDQILADVERLLAADPVDAEALDGAFQQLQWMIKLDDRQAAILAERMTTRQMGEAVARVTLGALGAAGTAAAQDALTNVRSDEGVDGPVREAATIACIQLAEPTAALVEGLARDADGTSPLQGSSLLVLGAIAPRAKNPLADGRSPVQKLLAMETDAVSRGDTGTWLLAIGNAAPPETIGIVQRYVTSSDPAVRAAACVALRRVADADAVPILVDRATSDTDALVRRDALLELGRRSVPEARAAVEYVAEHDTDLELQKRARRMLGEGA